MMFQWTNLLFTVHFPQNSFQVHREQVTLEMPFEELAGSVATHDFLS